MEISVEKALWEDIAIIARVIGPKLSQVEINNWISKNWGQDTMVKYIPKGFLVVVFAQESERCQILNQENWFVNGNPIYLQPSSPKFNPIPLAVYDSPVWIRLYNLPIEYWDDVVLEKIGRSLGTLLEVDEQIIENNLYKYARLWIVAVQRILSHITLSTKLGD
ncbi:hypothetical protein SUGI_1141170 [Cryptomeria japonica]|nr:hypothetical protein SUGI_1141170 [Cryptomeria japonica]